MSSSTADNGLPIVTPTRGHGLCARVGHDPIAVGHELPIQTDAARSARHPYVGLCDQRGASVGAATEAGTETSDDLVDLAAYRMRPGLLHDVIDIGVPAHRPADDVVRQRRACRHEAAWRRLVPPIPAATIASHFLVHLHRPFTRHRHLAGLWLRRCARGGGMAEILRTDVENLPAG